MQRLRNIFILAVPAILLLQMTLGASLWMVLREMHRHKVKKEILHSIPQEQLVDIVLSPSQLATAQFKDKGKEIIWNGRMYDILEQHIIDGQLMLRCFDDADETIIALRAKKAGEESDRNSFNSILRQFVLIGTDEMSKPVVPGPILSCNSIEFAEPQLREMAFFIDVLGPPPDVKS